MGKKDENKRGKTTSMHFADLEEAGQRKGTSRRQHKKLTEKMVTKYATGHKGSKPKDIRKQVTKTLISTRKAKAKAHQNRGKGSYANDYLQHED